MYVCMFSSAIRLRRSQPDVERPIRIAGLPIIAVVGILAALSAIVLGLTPPAGFSALAAGPYAAIIAGGVVVLAIPAQLLYMFRKPEWTSLDIETVEALEAEE
jgi:amino acid transporter